MTVSIKFRRVLSRLSKQVNQFVADSEYAATNEGRASARLWRGRAKIGHSLYYAKKYAEQIDSQYIAAIQTLNRLTKEILTQCNRFPNNDYGAEEWRGSGAVDEFSATIRALIISLRGRA